MRNKNGRGDVYQYDSTYQVTGVKYNVDDPTVGYAAATGATRTVNYSFDAMGNRASVTDSLNLTPYTANELDQYTAVGANTNFQYNRNGCLVSDGKWTFEYDLDNRLIAATREGLSVRYGYDGYGRRISKTFTHFEKTNRKALKELAERISEDDLEGLENIVETAADVVPQKLKRLDRTYVYSGDQIVEERDGNGAVVAKYIYESGIDRPVKVIKRNKAYYFMQDSLGNVTALINAHGKIVEMYTYDIYGSVSVCNALGNPIKRAPMTRLAFRGGSFRFTGREYDAETDLYHYRARAYSPELGRFPQPDPIGFAAGDVNLYRYCANNPVRWTDPYGLLPPFAVTPPNLRPLPSDPCSPSLNPPEPPLPSYPPPIVKVRPWVPEIPNPYNMWPNNQPPNLKLPAIGQIPISGIGIQVEIQF